jgi:predicted nuclease with RNAse H fold
MKGLTRRGMRLAETFRRLGLEVIESYPGAAQDILGIIRKRVDVRELMQGLLDFGIDGDFTNGTINHDKLDAVTSALVGYFYLTESYEALGNQKERFLIVPKAQR